MNSVVFNGNDRSPNSTTGLDLVAGLELIHHLLPTFLPPLLGHDQQKIEDAKDKNERKPEQEPAAPWLPTRLPNK